MLAGRTQLEVAHGHLEAIYKPARTDAERVALILHPHPLFGGNMDNPVVFHCAKALEACGFETLRINFRGVGTSTGQWDEGRGELADARSALEFLLASQAAAREVVVAGYSFGAAIGLQLGCADERVARVISVATPVGLVDLGAALAGCAKPKLFVHGDADDMAPLGAVEELLGVSGADADADVAAERSELRVIAGAGHFFERELPDLSAAIRDALSAR